MAVPTEAEFSDQALSDRQAGYERFANQAHVRNMLAAQGGFKAQTDFVAGRLAELKGQQPPAETKPKRYFYFILM